MKEEFHRLVNQSAAMGERFIVARNPHMLAGAVTTHTRYLKQGRMHLLTAGPLDVNCERDFPFEIAPTKQACRCRCIEGFDFLDAKQDGYLKLCRTADSDPQKWDRLVQDHFDVRWTPLPGIRRSTNELDSLPGSLARSQPDYEICEHYFGEAIREGRQLEMRLWGGPVRASLVFRPSAMEFRGDWCCVYDQMSGCHFRVTGNRLDTRKNKRVLRLFDASGECVGRFYQRDLPRDATSTAQTEIPS